MAEPVRLELAPGHVLTGRPSTEQLTRAHSAAPVRMLTFWHYDCSCRQLAWAPTALAERHAADVAGHRQVARRRPGRR